MDLIYMNSLMEDIAVLKAYEFDLAYGSDENDFELKVSTENHCCKAGYYVYIENTEYGGIIDAVTSDTANEEVTYTGRTWHGILNSKVLCPDSGQDYLTVSGEANTVLGTLISRMGLSALFAASTETSTLTLSSYKMQRYVTGYDGIRKMLKSVNGKLLMYYNGEKVILSAVPIVDYTDDGLDSDILSFTLKMTTRKVNHLICLGKGKLKDRLVVHLYTDASGNISQTQTQTGLDEYSAVYDYSSVEDKEDLIKEGTQRLSELQMQDDLDISLDETEDAYDVGDIVGATDNVTGVSIAVPISKKIVVIQNGRESISYETGDIQSAVTEEEAAIVNIIDTIGISANTRVGTSDGSNKTATGYAAIGANQNVASMINVSAGDVLRIKGMTLPDSQDSGCAICSYNSDASYSASHYIYNGLSFDGISFTSTDDMITIQFSPSYGYRCRISALCSDTSAVVATINQKIT